MRKVFIMNVLIMSKLLIMSVLIMRKVLIISVPIMRKVLIISTLNFMFLILFKASLAIADLLVGLIIAPILIFTLWQRGYRPALEISKIEEVYNLTVPKFGLKELTSDTNGFVGFVTNVSLFASVYTLTFRYIYLAPKLPGGLVEALSR